MLSPNSILQNRYRIVRELGHGGMGTVYEAIDQRVNCIVALKETLVTRDSGARTAFEREASLLANLRHQALPKVMDYFSENDGDFLVMEFIPGYDLAELLDLRGSPFPQSQVLRWADNLLRVLEYLHGQEPPILHRDIKPSNLKLTKTGEVFLLDFGLAKGSAGQMPTMVTNRSVRGYTPVYASLEQILSHGTDARSDIYSLGATLYHVLSGVVPIDAPRRFQLIEDGGPDPLQPIQQLNPQTTSSVVAVIEQAMAMSRKQRPISASEMRKALRNAVEEDERSSAEEEYRRAEENRRQREEEKRQAAYEAVPLGGEYSLDLGGAETFKKVSEPSRAAEDERRIIAPTPPNLEARDQGAHRRDETPKPPVDAKKAKSPAPDATIPHENVPLKKTQAPLSTIPAQNIELLMPNAGGQRQTVLPESVLTRRSGQSRGAVIAVVVVLLSLVGAFSVWKLTQKKDENIASNTQSNSQPAQPTNGRPAESKPTAPPGMVSVPGGEFQMGRNDGDEAERPAHLITVEPFFIDVYEVTNEDYEKFVRAGQAAPTTWRNGTYPSGAARRPVTGVSWEDANAYAKSVGKRLPSEEEWEFAARGTDGRRYPWGNDWSSGLSNAGGASGVLVDVGSKKGASPFGGYDMVGNAWEWTASKYLPYPGGSRSTQTGADLRVIRGCMYACKSDQATATYRRGWPATGADYANTGFRCAKDASQ